MRRILIESPLRPRVYKFEQFVVSAGSFLDCGVVGISYSFSFCFRLYQNCGSVKIVKIVRSFRRLISDEYEQTAERCEEILERRGEWAGRARLGLFFYARLGWTRCERRRRLHAPQAAGPGPGSGSPPTLVARLAAARFGPPSSPLFALRRANAASRWLRREAESR